MRSHSPCLLVCLAVCAGVPAFSQTDSAWHTRPDISIIEGPEHRRESSSDPKGANVDFRPVEPGDTLVLFNEAGPGRVARLWCTLDSKEEDHLRKVVLRVFWDGEAEPSINVPLGDFFGLGHGAYYHYVSDVMNAAVGRGMSCSLPMPFASRARIEIENQGEREIRKFYWHVDWQPMPEAPPEDIGRLHAFFNRENPTEAAPGTGFDDAYVLLDATGKGRYIGCVLSVQGLSPQWWGEGDELIELDGNRLPGTGIEDYFNCAWGFTQPFWADTFGAPYLVPYGDAEPEKATVYRWHTTDPYFFNESIRIRIEHGTQNDRADDYSSVAYWYQSEPHQSFGLMAVGDRLPGEFLGDVEEAADTESVVIGGAPAIEVKKPRFVPPTYDDEPTGSADMAALKMVVLAGWVPALLVVGALWYMKRRS